MIYLVFFLLGVSYLQCTPMYSLASIQSKFKKENFIYSLLILKFFYTLLYI